MARPLVIRRSLLAPFSAVALLGATSGRPIPTRDPRSFSEDGHRDETTFERIDSDRIPTTRVEVAADRIVLHEPIAFEFDRAVLRRSSHDLLLEIAMALHDHPEISHVRVEAHTNDEEAVDAGPPLSSRRARVVRDHLVHVGGVEPERVSSVGRGASRPIAPHSTADERARNRRIDLVIVARDEEAGSLVG